MRSVRALLINPWIYDFAAYDLWSKPIGLLRIASCLKKAGVGVTLIDCLDRFHPRLQQDLGSKAPKSTVFGDGHYHSEPVEKPGVFRSIPRRFKRYGMPPGLFRALLAGESPDVVLVTSGMTYWYPGAFEAIRIVKEHFPSVPVLLGGIYARLCPEHARRYSRADLVYAGSNIREVVELVGKLVGKDFDVAPAEAEDPDPAYELYPELHYITLRTSSGCPFRCSYCGWYLLENGFRQADPERVFNLIKYFAGQKVKNFSFYDDALLYNAESHLVLILEKVIKSRLKVNFHTPNGLHVRFITPGVARLLKRAGFVRPRLGLETASAARQAETGGKVNNEEFLRAVKFLVGAGYSPGEIAANIMMGLPGQDFEEVKESIAFAASAGVRVHLEEYSPVPGTPGFARSGLPSDCDPLLHNNSAFPLYRPEDYYKFQELKDLARRLNRGEAARKDRVKWIKASP